MEDITFQHVFTRVYNYLCEAGVDMTSERCRRMLQLIDDAVAELDEMATTRAHPDCDEIAGHRLLANAMDRLPDYFGIPEARIPMAAPPLLRSSIGYNHRG